MTVAINQQVPEFTAAAQTKSGEISFSLSDYSGKKLILYFYPKDNTPGCSTEGTEFNNIVDELNEINCKIVGVSMDSLRKHYNFIEKKGFNFPLIADLDESVSKLFDVIKLKKNFGKEYMGIERSTFIINEESVLTHEWRKVKVKGHVDEVLSAIKESL